MNAKILFAASAVALVVANAANALSLTPGYDSDFMGDVGVRYKSLANTGSKENYVGIPDLGNGANRSEQEFNWANGSVDFTFTIDLTNDVLTSTLGNSGPLTYAYTGAPTINALHLQVVDRDADGDVWLSNLSVNGNDLGDVTSASDEGWLDFMVTDLAAADIFSITGTINLDGTFRSSDELSKIQILAGSVPVSEVPLPAGAVLLLTGLGAVAVSRRRKR